MLQRVLGLLLSVIALFHLGTVAAAASLETETPFVFSVDRESYYGGERIELTVDTTTAQKDIAALRFPSRTTIPAFLFACRTVQPDQK